MGEHIDNRTPKFSKKIKEHNLDARRNRVSFKRYLRELEESLEESLDDAPDDDVTDEWGDT